METELKYSAPSVRLVPFPSTVGSELKAPRYLALNEASAVVKAEEAELAVVALPEAAVALAEALEALVAALVAAEEAVITVAMLLATALTEAMFEATVTILPVGVTPIKTAGSVIVPKSYGKPPPLKSFPIVLSAELEAIEFKVVAAVVAIPACVVAIPAFVLAEEALVEAEAELEAALEAELEAIAAFVLAEEALKVAEAWLKVAEVAETKAELFKAVVVAIKDTKSPATTALSAAMSEASCEM